VFCDEQRVRGKHGWSIVEREVPGELQKQPPALTPLAPRR